MTGVLGLFAVQGVLGAFDTLYYHEWRARLPGLGQPAHAELKLHAARDFLYAGFFVTLPWFAWQGFWAAVLIVMLMAEIAATLADFVVEERVRLPLGGLYAGERVTHALMGIVYGAILALLVPIAIVWWGLPARLAPLSTQAPDWLRWVLTVMGVGVLLSGLRDLGSVQGLPYSDWPWRSKSRGRA